MKMVFMARRRPLLGAAMLGGAGFMAGRAGARNASREASQEQRLQQLEAQPPAQAPPPAAAPASDDLTTKLKTLADLVSSGALTQDEFESAKRKLLAS
jgi:membrane protease subunit (stomatin/prohibitin family)